MTDYFKIACDITQIYKEQLMSQHTPGPWKVGDTDWAPGYRIQGVVTSDAGDIAQVTTIANARLIAQAPAMLDLLRRAFHKSSMGCPACLGEPCGPNCVGPEARALLKAIEG